MIICKLGQRYKDYYKQHIGVLLWLANSDDLVAYLQEYYALQCYLSFTEKKCAKPLF